jgi:hypothetical protein
MRRDMIGLHVRLTMPPDSAENRDREHRSRERPVQEWSYRDGGSNVLSVLSLRRSWRDPDRS